MYRIVVDQETEEQIDALPYEALAPLAELLDVLTIAPWNGDPINNSNPGGPLRMWPFGIAGILTYLILEDQRRVDLVRVVWVS
ncbi:MAG: hypothetical protein ACRDS9_19830 [Pseudonocardiaceae bacterium]